MGFRLETGDDGSLAVHGEIDLASGETLELAVRDVVHDGRVVIDLAGVTFIDSSGVRALVRISRSIAPARLVLRDATPRVERLFRLVGVDRAAGWIEERTNDGPHPDGPGA